MRVRVLVVGLVAAFLVAAMPSVIASHDTGESLEQDGSAIVSLAGLDASVEEGAAFNCDPGHPAQGIGAQVFELPEGFSDGDHSFVVRVPGTLDIDPAFYDADNGCESLGSGGAPLGFTGVDESGHIPEDATHVKIVYWAGAGDYTMLSPNPDDTCKLTPFC